MFSQKNTEEQPIWTMKFIKNYCIESVGGDPFSVVSTRASVYLVPNSNS